jgi:glycosyltransferase involved in cell wall biosynthesis
MEPTSVVTATYNRADLLAHTLMSVLAAIEHGDEIIVVDDGSTDATAAVVCASGAPWHGRVRYLPMAKAGAGRAFNAGIAAAAHDLVAFVDSDDLWLPYRLALQRPLMHSERHLAFCFSNFGQLMADGSVVPHWQSRWSGDERSWDTILARGFAYAGRWTLPPSLPAADAALRVHVGSMYERQLHANYICVDTILVRRSVVGDALHFGEDLPRIADWECYARIARTGECAYLDVDTALQRTHPGARLSDSGPLTLAQARMAVIERTWARDEDFMRTHAAEVTRLLSHLRRAVARNLIRQNRRDEARALLSALPGAWLERVALSVPDPVLQRLLRALRRGI